METLLRINFKLQLVTLNCVRNLYSGIIVKINITILSLMTAINRAYYSSLILLNGVIFKILNTKIIYC